MEDMRLNNGNETQQGDHISNLFPSLYIIYFEDTQLNTSPVKGDKKDLDHFKI